MDQKTMVHLHNGILSRRKKEGAPTPHENIDGTGKYYTKWSKPSGERQIPYDLIYKWSIINKINWQTKYSQRHWNRQQTDSNHKGGEREIMKGKGGKWTWMRDPWTEPRGVGIEGGTWAWVGQEKVVVGKWRQLYLNINKKKGKKRKNPNDELE